MLAEDTDDRYSIDEIENHPWMNGRIAT